eukprot:TRINITY_DN3531_c0_g1_i1.p1 TRINITY_DN3531_c0_g1~~TRINITY_DN3531_c0_g1_i1.p1  ORF type:complete len:291 (-),score=61.90 TRINITY_DN3531_c0_g1_i1:11-814(-)
MSGRVTVVTGANKGIGFGIAQRLKDETDFRIILTARDETRGKTAAEKLGVEFHQLDVLSEESVERFAKYIEKEHKGLDVLINNAGWAAKGDAFDENIARDTIGTNYYGVLRVTQRLLPLMNQGGRIVNISSSVGRPSKITNEAIRKKITDPNVSIDTISELSEKFIDDVKNNKWQQEGWPKTTYGISKVAVTALTRSLAKQHQKDGILINACCPGWIKTDMTSQNPHAKELSEGSKIPVWLATLPPNSTYNGEFFTQKDKPVDWENY